MPADQFRRDRIAALIRLNEGRGLEIGPLDNPLVLREESNVRYVDVVDNEALVAHYEQDPAVDTDAIPAMDYALSQPDGTIRSLAEAVAPGAPYDWVVASHVVEHVPDLLGWLADIAQFTEPGAKLILAIPDQRYTFDLYRPPTTVGQILQAHYDQDKRPSSRAIFDHFRNVVSVLPADLWVGRQPGIEARVYNLEQALGFLSRARSTDDYIDCHVWLFTPASFVEQIVELARIGVCSFVVDNIVSTSVNELEFYAVLRRGDEVSPGQLTAAALESGLQSFENPATIEATKPAFAVESAADTKTLPLDAITEDAPPTGRHQVILSSRELRALELKRSLLERARKNLIRGYRRPT